MAEIKLSKLKKNKQNPRFIRDSAFEKLVNLVRKYPKFLEKRPIVIRSWEDPTIIAGNMRFQALKALEYKTVPEEWVKTADGFTDDEIQAFTILDNNQFGQWDFDVLANEWDIPKLEEFNVFIPNLNGEAISSGAEDAEEVEDHIPAGLKIDGPPKPTAVKLDFLSEDDFRFFNEHIYTFGPTKEEAIINLLKKSV